MLDVHGFVATCNATNFFMIKNGEVWTSSGKYCMNGITRSKVITICEGMGIPCYQKDFSLFDVYGADEAFVTGTFGGLTPVLKIDGRVIGSGEKGGLTDRLSGFYKLLIESEVRKMKKSEDAN
jgi:branched-chain amino acid aminotransferase